MADRRKPEARIVLETPAGRVTAELFPAALFARKVPGCHAGRYRVRIGRAWHQPGGQKYVFLTLPEAFAALAGLAGLAPDVKPEPDLPVGTFVRAPSSYLAGQPQYTRTYTKSKPFQGPDGRWRVLCAWFTEPVLVEDIIKMEVKRQ
jgi:hypothetical protein